jgi:hypothetical protein
MREPDSHEEASRPPLAALLVGTTVFVGTVTLSGGLVSASLISTSCAAALTHLTGDRHTR